MTYDDIRSWHAVNPFGARDEAYIDAVLVHVKRLWLARPYERLGQALHNAAGTRRDLFNLRDEEWAFEGF